MSSEDDEQDANLFVGIRFLIHGFDPIQHNQLRSKLITFGGTIDINYNADVTHLIVCNTVLYDDDVCVAARRDEKVVVTELWVDYSLDIGMLFDTDLILFRPVRDLNGIPGANSLCICLTGYQKQYREDIMIMSGLMGAEFVKPLVAHKVTHLLCYEFEGEKYKLAKMTGNIKLVNHRWMEDCLKAWKLLPESNYPESGLELEMLDGKDSQEETENDRYVNQSGAINVASTRAMSGSSNLKDSELPKKVWETPKQLQIPSTFSNLPYTVESISKDKKVVNPYGKDSIVPKSQELHDRKNKSHATLSAQVSTGVVMVNAVSPPSVRAPNLREESSELTLKSRSQANNEFSHNMTTPKTSLAALKYSSSVGGPGGDSRESMLDDLLVGHTLESQKQPKDRKISETNVKNWGIDETTKPPVNQGELVGMKNGTSSRKLTQKTAKRNSGSCLKSSTGCSSICKGSLCLDKTIISIEGASEKVKGAEHMSIDSVKSGTWTELKENKILEENLKGEEGSGIQVQDKIVIMDDDNDTEAPEENSDGIDLQKSVEVGDSFFRFEEVSAVEGTIHREDGLNQDTPNKDVETSGLGKDSAKHGDGGTREGEIMTKRTKYGSTTNKENPVFTKIHTEISRNNRFQSEPELESNIVKILQKEKQVGLTASKRKSDALSLCRTKTTIETADKLSGSIGNLSETSSPSGRALNLKKKCSTPQAVDVSITNRHALEMSLGGLKQIDMAINSGGVSTENIPNDRLVGQAVASRKQQGDGEVSCIITNNSENDGRASPVNQDERKGIENETSLRKFTKKTVAKRSSGSRPKLSTSGSSTRKGSLILDKAGMSKESVVCSVEQIEGAEYENTDAVKPDAKTELEENMYMEERMEKVLSFEYKNLKNIVSVNDVKLAPEDDNVGKELQKPAKIREFSVGSEATLKETVEGTVYLRNNADKDSANLYTETNGLGIDAVDHDKSTCGKNAESLSKTEEKIEKRNKLLLSKDKEIPIFSLKQTETSKTDEVQAELEIKSDDAKMIKTPKLQHSSNKRKNDALSKSKTKKVKGPVDEILNSNRDSSERSNRVLCSSMSSFLSCSKEKGVSVAETGVLTNDNKLPENLETEMLKGVDCPINVTKIKAKSVKNPKKQLVAEKNKVKVNKKVKVNNTKAVELPCSQRAKAVSVNKPDMQVCAVNIEKKNNERVDFEKVDGVDCPGNKSKSKTSSMYREEKSLELENENEETNNDMSVTKNTSFVCDKTSTHANDKIGGTDLDKHKPLNHVSAATAWFLLTGERSQRKEFGKVIKQLKGRLCRDSHYWSFQATHLITPYLKRTEKFFAAAASGSWILNTDYVTASKQAGKFLAEEPYEWFQNILGEDGAIHLAAPRKWRLLKERTGHGAFYGMSIIFYGDFFVPPLDALKRAVKAGDGTILATSPPYTRLLKSNVDFAVVGSCIPNADSWIQEFLRHKIPCITPDYLIDFVCKPGFPLEQHVLYGTRLWAENSFHNLLSRSEEIIKDIETDEDEVDDIPCSVCESRDRGDVMLICGTDDGSLGCSLGTHIDCCDPPLEAVPEGDWFCAKCNESMKKTELSKFSKKKKSVRKSK